MKRLDSALVEWGLAPSRTKAQALIRAGEVELHQQGDWRTTDDQSLNVEALGPDQVRLKSDAQTLKYVSRGGLKLEAAVRHLGLKVQGWRCLDVGLSTGGFSDCLLQAGAKEVLGVDVGRAQLHPKLQTDPRLSSIEGLHVKDMPSHPKVQAWLKQGVDLAVVDVSFISLEHVLPVLAGLLSPGTRLLALVKPQFEVGPKTVEPEMFPAIQRKIELALDQSGFETVEYFSSPLRGQDGSQEFFVWANRR